ncbi:MAG: hypothetical protein O3C45_04955 [Bacteroidetes bacterium]|nr:hypothetical protein [Bacteroidota bacterium]MDA0874396.1 hypothetical protein [Bacteroidota bacterium]
MPEEIAILFVLMILSFFGITMTSMVLRHRRKQRENAPSSGASMTTSDLEAIMRRAVEDATAPLTSKIEDLEMELVRLSSGARQLPAHDVSTRLSLEEIPEEEVLDVRPISASRTKS